ncbi:hypothetical protein HYS50_00225 [Candidatus Woesearchaeota archaeon]|nr:hypothetical protein [Candidatus Woesearchaeota archaeon]
MGLDKVFHGSLHKVIPLVTAIRERFCQIGSFFPTPASLPLHSGGEYAGFVRYPPDPEQFRQSPLYTPSLQPHSFGVYLHWQQSSEQRASLHIRFFYGHDRESVQEGIFLGAQGLEHKVIETPQDALLRPERNGYTPYMQLVFESYVEEWKRYLAVNGLGQGK